MNKYIDYINEISKEELFDGLVGFGLFSEKIPNFLTSEAFLAFVKNEKTILNSAKNPVNYIRYCSMRNNSVPRFFGIPNPLAYAKQCQVLSDNWEKITEHFKNKTDKDILKVSRVHLRKLQGKPELFEMNYENFEKDGSPEDDIVINSNYVAYADISNCFPSIYSHSIPWALVGKPKAKKNRDKGKWFNQIDSYTRNLKNGETNGILIGPHSSSLISELILVDIDEKLVSEGFRYIRHIDDYKCYVDSHKQAEEFFLSLSEALKEHDLTLNHKKSKIISLPKASVGHWKDKLNCFNFKDFTYIDEAQQECINLNGVKFFINLAIELMLQEESDAAILNYAIQILARKNLNISAKNYYFKQVHHLVLLYSYLVGVLDKHIFNKDIFDKQAIQTIATDVFRVGINRKNYEACSFAVYWALKYDFEINFEIKNIENIEKLSLKKQALDSLDCIFMLISFLYDSKYQNNLYLQGYKDKANSLIKDDDFDKYWLYIYEVLLIDKIPDEVLPIDKIPESFKSMKKAKVSFIREALK